MTRVLLLTFACFIWGMGFVGTRWTLDVYDPYWSNALRFAFAALFSLPILMMRRSLVWNKGALICALCLFTALQLQTIGIGLTTLAKSGFLTAFYAIFTPLFEVVLYGRKHRKTYWFLVFVALVGIAFLCDLDFKSFNQGDAWVLASAVFFSLHILAVDYYGQKENALDFNFLQIIAMAIFGLVVAWGLKGPTDLAPLFHLGDLFTPSPLLGFLIVSIFSSMVAFSIQVYAQKGTRAHVVSLVFLTESVFSAFFGVLFFNEYLNALGLTGALIVLLSVGLIPIATRYQKKK